MSVARLDMLADNDSHARGWYVSLVADGGLAHDFWDGDPRVLAVELALLVFLVQFLEVLFLSPLLSQRPRPDDHCFVRSFGLPVGLDGNTVCFLARLGDGETVGNFWFGFDSCLGFNWRCLCDLLAFGSMRRSTGVLGSW